MKLKELIMVTDRETLVCVCDDMGPLTDVVKLQDISAVSLIDDLDRKVEKIYIDTDNSLTIILEDWREED